MPVPTESRPTATADVPHRVPEEASLLESKLHPPSARPGLVRREALIRRLSADRQGRLVAIVAPPGFGKTTLLQQWASLDRRRTAWLTLDDRDNDAPVFLAYLAAALARVEPLDGSIAHSFASPSLRVLSTVVPRIASALHRWERPARIILDDVHRLTDPTCLDALAELVDHLPRHVRLALGARSEPGLPLARLRAQGRLLEIVDSDLAFDESETAQAVRGVGATFDQLQIRRLWERTEGWPTGVYLATLYRARGPLSGPSVDLTGRHPLIADYLRSELIGSLDRQDVALLTRTAVLDTVVPAVADDLAGVANAAVRLETLADANLLIARLPMSEPAYRYHNLLREFLAAELERREPGTTPLLHLRAAASYRAQGRPELALDHTLAGGDVDGAARILTEIGLPTFYAGKGATLDRWLARFDDAALERHPPLATCAAWLHTLGGRAVWADHMADLVERAEFTGPPGDGTASFESGRSILQTMMCRRGPEDALARSAFAVEQERIGSAWRPMALIMHGSARLMVGETAAADEAFAEAVEIAPLAGATTMVPLANRALLALARGDHRAAGALAAGAESDLRRGHFAEIVSALLVYAAIARAALVVGDVERARAALARAQVLRPLATHAAPWFSVQSLVELGRAHLALADAAGARRLARDAEAIVRVRPALGTFVHALADLRRTLAEEESVIGGATSLTTAELRLLPLLPTYLTFQEIADRLYVSRNTVKTQALSLYGKLEATSRGEAVENAVRLGLIEPFPGLALARNSDTDRAGAAG